MKHLNLTQCSQVSGGFLWCNVPPPVIDPIVFSITEGNLIHALIGLAGMAVGVVVGAYIQNKVDYFHYLENMVSCKNGNGQ